MYENHYSLFIQLFIVTYSKIRDLHQNFPLLTLLLVLRESVSIFQHFLLLFELLD